MPPLWAVMSAGLQDAGASAVAATVAKGAPHSLQVLTKEREGGWGIFKMYVVVMNST